MNPMTIGMQVITNDNLEDHVEKTCELYCQLGVVISTTGKLLNGCGLCRWGIRQSNGVEIGFSFGRFSVKPNGQLKIVIS